MLLLPVLVSAASPARPATSVAVEANCAAEVRLSATNAHANPFLDPTVDAIVRTPSGRVLRVPAYWAGGSEWRVRYASPEVGRHTFRTECSDSRERGLGGIVGSISVTPYHGGNALLVHGPVEIAPDARHFRHRDGTPFLWLADTWWKGLAKRLTWDGFQQLTADRRAKGFSVVQIVCGPYPDEGAFEPRWENEGGKPYLARDMRALNPEYFRYADRRIQCLVDAGIVPAIVGGWGRADCDALKLAGVEGLKRHWRYLIARYGAYPTVWIVGGEAGGPQWTEVAKYVRQIDPYHRPVTMHPGESARSAVTDEAAISFDMLQTGHGGWDAATGAIPKLQAALARTPRMPGLIGEFCYEGHMQSAYQDIERYVFWASMLSGAAGLTYGAAGVWHASVDGDPGITPVYDFTTWRQGMGYPGSTQLGLGKRLLERYPWSRMEPHPEWAEAGSFAAGIPGELRIVYQPRRGVYNWSGSVVKRVEPGVAYHAFYFDPCTGKRYDEGRFVCRGQAPKPYDESTMPALLVDRFDGNAPARWSDLGSATSRENGSLVAVKGALTVMDAGTSADIAASVEAGRDAEAGIVLRYQSQDRYVVALYSPMFKSIYIHDRVNGQWGDQLGVVAVPDIGPRFRISAAARGGHAAMVISDGARTYWTPVVSVCNVAPGKVGLWMYQIGDRQEFRDFRLLSPPARLAGPMSDGDGVAVIWSDEYRAPNVPSPQDWVLVLERVDGKRK